MAVNQRRAGAVLSYVSLAVHALLSFIYVPLLIHGLTVADYGVYEMIGSIIAYLSVMDMGLSTTLNRYYVKTKHEHGDEALSQLLCTAAIIYLLLTLCACLVAVGFDAYMDTLFSDTLSEAELVLAHQMMLLVIVNCAFVLPGNWFLAIINANERFVFARSISLAKYVLQFLAIIAVLFFSSNAVAVLLVQVILNFLGIVVYAVYCFAVLRTKIERITWNGRLAISLLSFSFFILLNMVFDQVFWKTGQVILGAVSGAVAVAVYSVITKFITSGFMQVSTGITSVFLPQLTKLEAQGNQGEINGLFNRIGRLQAMMVWGLIGWFIALGYQFIGLWIGDEMDNFSIYVCIMILMFGLCVSLIQNLGLSILQAKNKMAFRAWVYIVLAAIDVLVTIPLARLYGVEGCAIVAAILLFIGTGPIMNVYYSRVIGLDISKFWRKVLPLIVPVVIATLVFMLVNRFFSIPISWVTFVIQCLLYVLFYLFILKRWFFNEYENGLWREVGLVLKRRRR